jgi:hypothetical protein
VLLLGLALVPKTFEASTNPATLTFQSETHQRIGTSNCYNAQVTILLTDNDSNSTFLVQVDRFYLYSTGSNLHLSNSTNYAQPNNKLQLLVLFPLVPVSLTLSFTNFCLPVGLTSPQVWLFYFDGVNTLKVQIV